MLLIAFTRAFADMFSRDLIVVMLKSAGVTLALFVLFGFGLYAALDYSDLLEGGFGARFDTNLATLLYAIAAVSIALIGAWLLFRIVIIAVIGLFADDIIDSIEARHYPHRAGQGPGVMQSSRLAAKSLVRLFWVNLIFSPVYIVLMVTGVGTAIAFLLANGWALGRDLDDTIRFRKPKASSQVAALPPLSRFLLGLGATFATTIPVVQIFVPVMAVAIAVHLAHGRMQ